MADEHKDLPYAFNEPGLQKEVSPYTAQDFLAEMGDPTASCYFLLFSFEVCASISLFFTSAFTVFCGRRAQGFSYAFYIRARTAERSLALHGTRLVGENWWRRETRRGRGKLLYVLLHQFSFIL